MRSTFVSGQMLLGWCINKAAACEMVPKRVLALGTAANRLAAAGHVTLRAFRCEPASYACCNGILL